LAVQTRDRSLTSDRSNRLVEINKAVVCLHFDSAHFAERFHKSLDVPLGSAPNISNVQRFLRR
jgi:hypothetical protein